MTPFIETPQDVAALFFIVFFSLYGLGAILDVIIDRDKPTRPDE